MSSDGYLKDTRWTFLSQTWVRLSRWEALLVLLFGKEIVLAVTYEFPSNTDHEAKRTKAEVTVA